jgi:hypothetical protein
MLGSWPIDNRPQPTKLPYNNTRSNGVSMRNVLSIRGGGIRGIIPCRCLIELEAQRTKDKPIIRGFKYDPRNLHDVRISVFGAAASWTANDCPIGVMISGTAMDGHNWFFVKDNDQNRRSAGGDQSDVPGNELLPRLQRSSQRSGGDS